MRLFRVWYSRQILSSLKGASFVKFHRKDVSSTCLLTRNVSYDRGSSSSSLGVLKRITKKKPSSKTPSVLAFSTCEAYDLNALTQGLLNQGLYETHILPEESEALYAQAKYVVDDEHRHVFFFQTGSVVFWNFSDIEASGVLNFLRSFEISPYDRKVVEEEGEVIEFFYGSGPKSRLYNGKIELSRHRAESESLHANDFSTINIDLLEMYAFSNGLALSVKLAIWESTLEDYVCSIEGMIEDIRFGRKLSVTREHVFRKTGELFALRHKLNLSPSPQDTPDFYWDREELENLFVKTGKHYSLDSRIRVMKEKIEHCQELMELISHHLEDKHHVRLELMIIILIVVEVIFETVHYVERFTNATESKR